MIFTFILYLGMNLRIPLHEKEIFTNYILLYFIKILYIFTY